MAAVTLPTHYRNVFAELGYAQAEIDARRYYDNCLYFFALLALSGRYYDDAICLHGPVGGR